MAERIRRNEYAKMENKLKALWRKGVFFYVAIYTCSDLCDIHQQ